MAASDPVRAAGRRGRAVQAGAWVWAVVGASVALGALPDVNADARPLVALASVVGPLLAAWAALALPRHGARRSGALLVLSALVTPTYFAAAINVPVLVAGLALVVAPHLASPPGAPEATRPGRGLVR